VCSSDLDVALIGARGDVLPGRGFDLLGGGAALVGQFEKPFATMDFRAAD
jgi:hypothetical protein